MTWHELNTVLRRLKTESAVLALITEEMRQEYPRERWVLRMHCRLRRLRTQREVRELARSLRRKKVV